jgi:hypothetical protein
VQDATLHRAANDTAQTIANYLDPTPSTVLPFPRLASRV